MQTYWDLSEKERAALSHEDVERFLDAELMTKGVLRVPPLALQPEPETPQPSRTFYRIRHGHYLELDALFPTAEDAQRHLEVTKMRAHVDYIGGQSITFASTMKDPEVVAVRLLTESEKDAHKAALARAGAVRGENERRTREHDEAVGKQEEALSGLWGDWHACVARAERMERVRATFEEYKRIAGDPQVASQFLRKAFPPSEIAEMEEWFGVDVTSSPAETEHASAQ